MASCLRARGRKMLRNLVLKLFSRGLAFIVILYFFHTNGHVICHHVAVAGFWSASFGGGRKSGGERGRLLDWGLALK
jgi:hypothetical protein